MSYNGSGTFNINSAGQPVVTGTVITSTAFNALTADLATGLSTAITKDGQTTPTANIPMGTYKITGLGAGTVATDAVRLSQLQNGSTTTYITAAGTDTITGTVTPALTAYATGQQFSFVVAATNTTAVTLNIDSVGAKAVTRTGSVALVAGDMVTGQVVIVEYDGTRFQLINGNSFTNLKASGTLGVTGVATFTAAPVISSITNTGTLTLPTLTGTVGLATRTVQVFASGSGTYTTPTGCKAIFVQCWGGGGSGAAGNTTNSTRGAGAGAGAYSQKLIASPAATYTYAVGAGAVGVVSTAGGATGNTGGTSTFSGSSLSCSGGVGGGAGAAAGGAGGSSSGGDLNIPGGAGMAGQNGSVVTAVASGGSSPMGGPGGQSNISTPGETPGGGGSCSNHTAASTSGAGGSGLIIVQESY